jgi:histidyl-tRNA synthetase
MKKQLSYASEKGIRFALIYGTDEKKEGNVTIKDLEKGTQEKLFLRDIFKIIGE